MNQTEEIKKHKNNVIEKIINKQNKPSYYPIEKMIRTLSCEDTDCISKVPNAGIIINDESSTYQLMHNGIKVIPYAYNGEWMSDVILGFQGHHEPQEEKVFYEVIKAMPEKATMMALLHNSLQKISLPKHRLILS